MLTTLTSGDPDEVYGWPASTSPHQPPGILTIDSQMGKKETKTLPAYICGLVTMITDRLKTILGQSTLF
jgi:hypothetical protein